MTEAEYLAAWKRDAAQAQAKINRRDGGPQSFGNHGGGRNNGKIAAPRIRLEALLAESAEWLRHAELRDAMKCDGNTRFAIIRDLMESGRLERKRDGQAVWYRAKHPAALHGVAADGEVGVTAGVGQANT